MTSKSTTALETPLREQLDRLASIDPGSCLSLYLDLRPDQNGQRTPADVFLRNNFEAYKRPLRGEARSAIERVEQRVRRYVGDSLPRSAKGVAIFASTTTDMFEAIPLDVPIEPSSMHLDSVPHLYPLARLNDQYPRYAALLVDTNKASLFVFALGAKTRHESVQNEKTRRTRMGGMSQARYQRHADNFHKQHIKEVVELLDKVVSQDAVSQIVVACDEVARPYVMAALPRHLADKLIDTVSLDAKAMPAHELLDHTMSILREADAQTDAEHVERMLGAWRAGQLGVAGVDATLRALDMQQVEELLIAARPDRVKGPADDIVARAQRNSARIRFIENDDLLKDVDGVGALLRFRV